MASQPTHSKGEFPTHDLGLLAHGHKEAKSSALKNKKEKVAGKMKRMTDAEKYDKAFREGKEPPHARVSNKLLKHLRGEK